MQKTYSKNILKEKSVIMLMIFSAFAGIYYAISAWLNLSDLELNSEISETRTIQTEKLVAEADTNYFITCRILPLLRFICENPEKDIGELQKQYLEEYDLDLTIYQFGADKKLLKTAPEKATNLWLMKNMFPLLTETDVKKINTSKKELDKKIEFAFGHGKDLVSIKNNPEIIINTVCSGKECFFTWSYRERGGVFIFVARKPNKDKVLEYAISKVKKNELIYANKLDETSDCAEAREAREAYAHCKANSLENGIFANKCWHFVTTKNNEKYYTAYKVSNTVYSRGLKYLNFLFFVIIPITFFRIIKASNLTILSLKRMVVLIFIASSIIPLAAIFSTSFESMDAYKKIYKNTLKSSMEEAIGNIMQHFTNYLKLCTNRLMTLTEVKNNNYDFEKMEKDIVKEFPKARFGVRDSACQSIFCNAPDFSSGQEEITKSVFNVYIEKNAPERLSEAKYNGNPFSDALVRKDDMGFSWLTKSPNELIFFNNGGSKMLMFVRLLPKEAGRATLLNVQPDLEVIINSYVKSVDSRTLVSKQQQILFSAYNPLKFRWRIPPKLSEMKLLEQAKASYVIGKPLFRTVSHNGKSFLSLCIPNSDIDEICYLGSLSIEKLQHDNAKQKLYLAVSAVIALILLMSVVFWLMKQLIDPLGNLEIGIQALGQRKFETKLPVPEGNDELVQLFKEFNFMMGESYDMQIAKNVQEGLITQKFPAVDGFVISGFSKPEGDLGGDCLTSFSLPDGKILFMIGDLTGHSIGSALMMAFVRAVTFNWTQKPNDDPLTLVEEIDNLLRDNKMKNMFMGIVCGILDPANSSIKFVTCGHIYPMFIRNGGKVEWLGNPSFPLGIGRKRQPGLLETTLFPGERMLCISDGFIEINEKGGITTGYEKIREWADKAMKYESEDWIYQIKVSFENWCKEKKVSNTDDITLFAIISKGAQT